MYCVKIMFAKIVGKSEKKKIRSAHLVGMISQCCSLVQKKLFANVEAAASVRMGANVGIIASAEMVANAKKR